MTKTKKSVLLWIVTCLFIVCTMFAFVACGKPSEEKNAELVLDEETTLMIGEQDVAAGKIYNFVVGYAGDYTFTVTGAERYEIKDSAGTASSGDTITATAGSTYQVYLYGTGTVKVNIEYEEPEDNELAVDEETILAVGENVVEAGKAYQFIAGYTGTYSFQIIGAGDYKIIDGLGRDINEHDEEEAGEAGEEGVEGETTEYEEDTAYAYKGQQFYVHLYGKGSVQVNIEFTEDDTELEIDEETILMIGEQEVYAGKAYQFIAGYTGTYYFKVIGAGYYEIFNNMGQNINEIHDDEEIEPVEGAEEAAKLDEDTVFAIKGETFYVYIYGIGTVQVEIEYTEPEDGALPEIDEEIILFADEFPHVVYGLNGYKIIAGWTGDYTVKVIGTGEYKLTTADGTAIEPDEDTGIETFSAEANSIYYIYILSIGTYQVDITYIDPDEVELELSDVMLAVGDNEVENGKAYQFIVGYTGTYTFKILDGGNYVILDGLGYDINELEEGEEPDEDFVMDTVYAFKGQQFYVYLYGVGTNVIEIEMEEDEEALEIDETVILQAEDEEQLVEAGKAYKFIAGWKGTYTFVVKTGDYEIYDHQGKLIEQDEETFLETAEADRGDEFYIYLHGMAGTQVEIYIGFEESEEELEVAEEPILMIGDENYVQCGSAYQFIAGYTGTYTFKVIGTTQYKIVNGLGRDINERDEEETAEPAEGDEEAEELPEDTVFAFKGESFYVYLYGMNYVQIIIEYEEPELEDLVWDEESTVDLGDHEVDAGKVYEFTAPEAGEYLVQVVGTGDYVVKDADGEEVELEFGGSVTLEKDEKIYVSVYGIGTVQLNINPPAAEEETENSGESSEEASA